MAALLCGALLLGLGSEALLADRIATVGVGLAGFLAGLSFAVFWRSEQMQASALLGYVLGVVITAGIGIALTHEIGAGRAIVLLALGAGAFFASMAAIRRMMETNEPVGLESEWGGLGQGLGGWRLSTSATLTMMALVLAGMAAGVAIIAPPSVKTEKSELPAQTNEACKKPTGKELKGDGETIRIMAGLVKYCAREQDVERNAAAPT